MYPTCVTVYCPDQQMHNIYIYIYQPYFIQRKVLLHVSIHPHHLQGVLYFYFTKVHDCKTSIGLYANDLGCIDTCSSTFVIQNMVDIPYFPTHIQECLCDRSVKGPSQLPSSLRRSSACLYIQDVPGGMCQTSGECSLC